MPNYMTRQGDMLDDICWRYYKTERGGTVEAVLAANPGLANQGTTYAPGIIIVLPELTPAQLPTKKKTIKLWD